MAKRKTYKTMQGKQIDIDLLRQRHELTPAVGNTKVNARGDQIGTGGRIVKKREELVSNKPMPDEVPVKKQSTPTGKDLEDDWEEPEPSSDWVEDEDGNFVKREDK